MTRFLSCLALATLVTACAPAPKAVEVVEPTKPIASKPVEPVTNAVAEAAPMPTGFRRGGMLMPDMTRKLPDEKDFRPTVDLGRSDLRATPPPPGKPHAE